MPTINDAKALGVGKYTKVEYYVSTGAITAKTAVVWDTGESGEDRALLVKEVAAAGDFAGIALEAATAAGESIPVAVKGYVEDVITDTTVTIGEYLATDSNGKMTLYAGTEAYPAVAYSLEADTSDEVDLIIL